MPNRDGNGPRSGDPVKMKVLLFSTDPVALDATACRIIDLNPEYVPTSKPGKEWGLGVYDLKEIELRGESIEKFINKNFKVERIPVSSVPNNGFLYYIKNMFTARPIINNEKCVRCGVCVKACPVNPKALKWGKDKKKYQYDGP